MYKNRVKIVVLLLAMVLVDGCAGKRDFTKGVSEEDKKLLSSSKDKGLFRYKTIVITQNGFYSYYKSKYNTKVASYLDVKKFNLKKFMDDVNKYNLKSLRTKVLSLKKKYPSVSLINAKRTEIRTIFSPNISQNEIDKILVRNTPSYLNKIINPSKELKQIALNSRKANCTYDVGRWDNDTKECWTYSRINLHNASRENKEERERKLNSSSKIYSGSGGYSGSSSSSSNSTYRLGEGYSRPGLGDGHSSQY